MMLKVTIGDGFTFRWAPQDPSTVALAGTLTVNWPINPPNVAPSTPTDYALTARAPDVVANVSSDRKVLSMLWSVENAGPPAGFIGAQPEPAWLNCGPYGQFPVRIARLLTTDDTGAGTLALADALPTGVVIESGATLTWLTLTADIPAEDVPAGPVYPVRWTVDATIERLGIDYPDEHDRGMLAVVWQPFQTGLTDARLASIYPWTANARPAGVQSWAGAIEAGLDRLISDLRPAIAVGKTEDDLNGPQFLRLHGLATAMVILDDLAARGAPRAEARAQAQTDYDAALKLALSRLDYLDLDGNGQVTDADKDVNQGWPGLGGSAQSNPNAVNLTIDSQAVPPPPVARATVFGAR